MSHKRKTTSKVHHKDTDQPIKPQSAFFYYKSTTLDELKKNHPEESQTVLSEKASQNWENLPAEEKKEYELHHEKELEQYKIDIEAWKLKHPGDAFEEKTHSDVEEDHGAKTPSRIGAKKSKVAAE